MKYLLNQLILPGLVGAILSSYSIAWSAPKSTTPKGLAPRQALIDRCEKLLNQFPSLTFPLALGPERNTLERKALTHILFGDYTDKLGKTVLSGGLHTTEGLKQFLKQRRDIKPLNGEDYVRLGRPWYIVQTLPNNVLHVRLPESAYTNDALRNTQSAELFGRSGYGWKTFFPEALSAEDIVHAIGAALEHPEAVKKNRAGRLITGTANIQKDGLNFDLKLQIALDPKGNIISAYPTWDQPVPTDLELIARAGLKPSVAFAAADSVPAGPGLADILAEHIGDFSALAYKAIEEKKPKLALKALHIQAETPFLPDHIGDYLDLFDGLLTLAATNYHRGPEFQPDPRKVARVLEFAISVMRQDVDVFQRNQYEPGYEHIVGQSHAYRLALEQETVDIPRIAELGVRYFTKIGDAKRAQVFEKHAKLAKRRAETLRKLIEANQSDPFWDAEDYE